MSAAYLGTMPVQRETSNYIDQDGVFFSSMTITAQAASAPALIPAIGSDYALNSSLGVTGADLSFSPDGLGTITVTAAGPSSSAVPRYRIIPGAPLIYGLLGNQETSGPPSPPKIYGSNMGLGIEVTLVAAISQTQTILQTYQGQAMPSSINGITLPATFKPGRIFEQYTLSNPANPIFTPVEGPEIQNDIYSGFYFGYVCTSIRTEQRGKAAVFVLSFQEKGNLEVITPKGSIGSLFSFNM